MKKTRFNGQLPDGPAVQRIRRDIKSDYWQESFDRIVNELAQLRKENAALTLRLAKESQLKDLGVLADKPGAGLAETRDATAIALLREVREGHAVRADHWPLLHKVINFLAAIDTASADTAPADAQPRQMTEGPPPMRAWHGLKIHVFNGRLVLEDDQYVIAAVDCADIISAAIGKAGV